MTDWEFVLDGVVGFLKSPMWNVPILTFIEKNCIVFDPREENELVYMEIYKEYSALVEDLLTSYLKDVGISEEQFVMACEAGTNDRARGADRSIFEQVWAGEDFELFKSLMIKKNLDLELQALQMIQQRNGVVPDVFTQEVAQSSASKTSKNRHEKDEENLMKQVMEQSKLEYEKEKEKKKEVERMEKSLALSKEESERLHELAERELNELERMVKLSLKLEKRCAQEKVESSDARKEPKQSSESRGKSCSPKSTQKKTEVKSTDKSSAKKTPKPESASSKPSVPKQKPGASPAESKPVEAPKQNADNTEAETKILSRVVERTPAEAAADWILSAKTEAGKASSKNPSDSQSTQQTASEDETMKRAQYMRMQREKLMNLKKQERAKRLQTFENQQPVKRPMSSRAARRATHGKETEDPVEKEANEMEEKKLAMRRALAERLKKEVINVENDSS